MANAGRRGLSRNMDGKLPLNDWAAWGWQDWSWWAWDSPPAPCKGAATPTSEAPAKTQETPERKVEEACVQHAWKLRAQDWSDPTLPAKMVQDVEDVSRELDTKQKQRLVCATTRREEADEALEMLMADTLAKGVVFLQGHGDLNEENMKAAQRAKYQKVAGQLGSKIQPREGWLWLVGDSSVSKARAGTSKPFQAKARPDSTVVLCFVAEKHYSENNWKKLQKTPTRFLRDWCLAVSAHASHGCHDAFGFECIDDHMVKSLMRVDKDKLSDIWMAASGSCQSNCWWYVEQVGPQNAGQAAQWVPCRHDDSETWVQYIDRC